MDELSQQITDLENALQMLAYSEVRGLEEALGELTAEQCTLVRGLMEEPSCPAHRPRGVVR